MVARATALHPPTMAYKQASPSGGNAYERGLRQMQRVGVGAAVDFVRVITSVNEIGHRKRKGIRDSG